jgi:hypothetical protein
MRRRRLARAKMLLRGCVIEANRNLLDRTRSAGAFNDNTTYVARRERVCEGMCKAANLEMKPAARS